MKAKILKTGEIVNIAEYAKITLEQCDSWGNPVEVKPEEVELIRDTPDYEAEFSEFRKDNPTWGKYLTDSTFYEMMSWYDEKHGLANEDHYSDEGRAFANYVWNNYIEDESDIDWERRRYEIAKEAMPAFTEGVMSNTLLLEQFGSKAAERHIGVPQYIAEQSVHYADALIEELKKKSK